MKERSLEASRDRATAGSNGAGAGTASGHQPQGTPTDATHPEA